MFGLYGMLFALLAAGLTALALLWHQRWSPFIFSAGIALAVLLAVLLVSSIYFNLPDIYTATGINIYVVFFLAALLLFAGGFGLSVKCIRWLVTVLSKCPSIS